MVVEKPFVITPAYDILLRGSETMPIGLCHLHLASAEQLCRLHYSMNSVKAVRAKLRLLADHGYVQIDETPTKRFRSKYHYVMGKAGIDYLRSIGMDVNMSFRDIKETDKNYLFINHTLDINDIIISAALLKRSNQYFWLESFVHERELKRKAYKATWANGSFNLIPDAFLIFRMIVPDGRQRRMSIVIEHDRGTEEQQYFRKRIRSYLIMLRNEGYKELFGVGGITIAFTTSGGEQRLRKMRDWTLRELEAIGESQSMGDYFYFTALTKPIEPCHLWLEPCWYTLHSDKPISLLGV